MIQQKITVFQQNRDGENKIRGIREYGRDAIVLDVISIDDPLPPVIDDTTPFITGPGDTDLVLDFLKHPDLSSDLAVQCVEKGTPIVASGKKVRIKGVFTPFT